MNDRDSFWLKFFQMCFTQYTRFTNVSREELRGQEVLWMLRTVENSPHVIWRWPFLRVHMSFSKELIENPKHKQKNTAGLLKGRFLLQTFKTDSWPAQDTAISSVLMFPVQTQDDREGLCQSTAAAHSRKPTGRVAPSPRTAGTHQSESN